MTGKALLVHALTRGGVAGLAIDTVSSSAPADHTVFTTIMAFLGVVVAAVITAGFGAGRLRLRRGHPDTQVPMPGDDPVVVPPPQPGEPVVPLPVTQFQQLVTDLAETRAHAEELQRRLDAQQPRQEPHP